MHFRMNGGRRAEPRSHSSRAPSIKLCCLSLSLSCSRSLSLALALSLALSLALALALALSLFLSRSPCLTCSSRRIAVSSRSPSSVVTFRFFSAKNCDFNFFSSQSVALESSLSHALTRTYTHSLQLTRVLLHLIIASL